MSTESLSLSRDLASDGFITSMTSKFQIVRNPLRSETSVDPFVRHRLALSVIDADLSGAAIGRALDQARASSWAPLGDFLVSHKLASLWRYLLEKQDVAQRIDSGFDDTLKRARLESAAAYLGQGGALREIDRVLNAKGVAYAVIKGAQVRERVYPDASLRPACDIDILVRRQQRLSAARALIGAGYVFGSDQENLSHEATFSKGLVDVDLHWDILRPGRTRCDVVETLLSRRQRMENAWGLDDSDTAFLMLVHPAFTRYVTSPRVALITVVDFLLWLKVCRVDWNVVARRLEDTGLKTAAWAVLSWFLMISPPDSLSVPTSFIARIRPGQWRARYLTYWLQHDLAGRWFNRPALIQFGLTLFLHDRPSDALRALASVLGARLTQRADLRLWRRLINQLKNSSKSAHA